MMRRLLAAIAALTLVLTGCTRPSLGVLPAAGGVSGPTYEINAEFDDTLNLVIGARVKLEGAVIGQVTKIETRDYRAVVRIAIKDDVKVPAASRAEVRFTTPLGEDFIAIYPPAKATGGDIAPGGTLPVANTSSAPTIEDTFAALSIVLNGGGLDDLSTIIREINNTLDGRAPVIRDTLQRTNAILARFDARKGDFLTMLDSLNRMTTALANGTQTIDKALTQMPPALEVIAADTGRLIELLKQVGSLSAAARNVIDRSSRDAIAAMSSLNPVLKELVASRDRLLPTLEALNAFGVALEKAAPGDYINIAGTLRLLWGSPAYRPSTATTTTSAQTVTSLLGAGR